VNLEAGTEQTGEEAETDDVVHVQMREEHIDAPHLGRERRAENADAGTGVNAAAASKTDVQAKSDVTCIMPSLKTFRLDY
jgi:hypothetical protein